MKHWVITALTALTALSATAADPAAPVSYRDAIAPIFQEKCTGCHGEQKQKGGLRLDTYAAVMKGGEDGAGSLVSEKARCCTSPFFHASAACTSS